MSRKRAAPKPPTLDDLENVTDLDSFFDLLDLPNGTVKQVSDRSTISGEPVRKKPKPTKTASTTNTQDLKNYGWVFRERLKGGRYDIHPHAQPPGPQDPVPFSERPTLSISGNTTAMMTCYMKLFKSRTRPLKHGPADGMLRLPADWRDQRISGPSLATEDIHSWLNALQRKVAGTIDEFESAADSSATSDSRATSEPASQRSDTLPLPTFDFMWSIWRHRKCTLFNDRDNDHNMLVQILQGTDFVGRVAFVHRSILEKECLMYRTMEGNYPSKPFHFDALLSEVKYDMSIRAQACAETDVAEEWSPIWIDHVLGEVYKLQPEEALPRLKYFLAHLEDMNDPNDSLEPLLERNGVELDRVYLDGREDYIYWRDRYLLSPQKLIENAIASTYRFKSRDCPGGELNVERSFDPFIAILRYDSTELKSGCNLDFPKIMQPFSSTPQPDIACRMISKLWSTNSNLRHTAPAIFIGEAKAKYELHQRTLAQIAMSVHPNLLLMVLYYLDHRKYGNDPAPDWLFFFSIRYFPDGLIIYGHYFDWSVIQKRFKFIMVPVAEDFRSFMMTPSKVMNLKVASTLGSIRSHNYFITEMLKRWKGTLRKKFEELCPPPGL